VSSFDSSCRTCGINGQTNCLTCPNETYLQNLVGPSSCRDNCWNSSTYPDDWFNVCESCDISCLTCNGNSSESCMSCRNVTYLQKLIGPSSCEKTCPDGTYPDNLTNICQLCQSPCKTCTLNGTSNCTSCVDFTYLQPNNGPTTCNITCPTSYYGENSTNTCDHCYDDCLNCTTASSFNCTYCRYLNDFLQDEVGPNSCNLTCPDNKYYNDHNNSCTSTRMCRFDLYLYEYGDYRYQCLVDCPSHYFESLRGEVLFCRECDDSCTECEDYAEQCIACSEGHEARDFKINHNVCFCNDTTICLPICPYNMYLYQNSCLLQCPDGTYQKEDNPLNYTCMACESTCETCVGPSRKDCTSCDDTLNRNFSGIEANDAGECNCSSKYFEIVNECFGKLKFSNFFFKRNFSMFLYL